MPNSKGTKRNRHVYHMRLENLNNEENRPPFKRYALNDVENNNDNQTRNNAGNQTRNNAGNQTRNNASNQTRNNASNGGVSNRRDNRRSVRNRVQSGLSQLHHRLPTPRNIGNSLQRFYYQSVPSRYNLKDGVSRGVRKSRLFLEQHRGAPARGDPLYDIYQVVQTLKGPAYKTRRNQIFKNKTNILKTNPIPNSYISFQPLNYSNIPIYVRRDEKGNINKYTTTKNISNWIYTYKDPSKRRLKPSNPVTTETILLNHLVPFFIDPAFSLKEKNDIYKIITNTRRTRNR